MQSTLLKEQYVGYDLAVHGTATFRVPDRVDQSDNSVRTCESAGADRTVERFVHRVTTALRPGSDAVSINLRSNGRPVYRVIGSASVLRFR